MVKRVARRMMIAIAGFLLLIVLIAGYSQTQMFRDHVRSLAESRAESMFNADFYVGRIEGNLITGFSIDSLAVTVDSVTLLAVQRVDTEYDLFSLSRKNIRVLKVHLLRPDIRILSDRDGVWNFETMIRSSPDDSSAGEPLDWTIALNDLSIEDGRFSLVDSSALADPDHGPVRPGFIEYHQIVLTDLQLEIGGEVSPSGKTLTIRKLSALSSEPGFELRHFSGEFAVTTSEAAVRDLTILTGGSTIELAASMKEIDLLEGIDLFALRTNPVEVALKNSDVDLNELAMFIPDIDFLNGIVSTDLEAAGTFGDLRVRRLHLAFGQTEFHLNGMVFNLHSPEDLYLDVSFRNSTVHTDDARSVLPSFNLPDLADLGVSRFALDFTGEPLDFDTRITVENEAGEASAEAHLTIGGPSTLVFDASARFDRLDLGPLSGGDSSETSLNGTLVVAGAGVDLEHLNGRIDLDVDSSRVYGNEMGASSFRMRVNQGSLEGTVDGTLGRLNASLATRFEDLLSPRPRFNISGKVSSLDIGEVLHDDRHRSDITMHLDASGDGLSPGTVSGEFRIDFIRSSYQAFDFDSGSVVVKIDQHIPDDRTISLESSLADMLVRGSFDLSYLADLILFEKANLTAALKEKFAVVDSTLLDGTERAGLSLLASELEERNMPINTTFEVSIKDLEPISIMTGERTFDGVGTLKGHAKGDFHNLSLSAELNATELFYGTVESGFYIKGGRIELAVQNLTPVEDPFNDIRIEFITEADALHLSLDKFDSLGVSLSYEDRRGEYSAVGVYSGDFGFLLNGNAAITDDRILFNPEIFDITLKKDRWTLGAGALLEFREDGALFRNLTFSNDSQEVHLEGSVGIDGRLNGALVVNRIGLGVFESFLQSEEDRPGKALLDGIASVQVDASGTVSDPLLLANITAYDVSIRGQPFGELNGTVRYEGEMAGLDLSVARKTEDSLIPVLHVGGSIPFRFPFSDGDTSGHGTVDLRIKSDGMQISFLDPLVPTFDDLSGLLECDLLVTGHPDSLVYDGSFSVSNTIFLFEPNNIQYRFEGRFRPIGDRIQIIQASAENIPSDNPPGRNGRVDFSGDFRFRNFVPSDFNIFAHGELLLVRPESRSSPLPIYGDLYIETGPGGLHFTGTVANSLLTGDVQVQRSRIVFPATSGSTGRESFYSIPIIVVDDTSVVTARDEASFRERYFLGDQSEHGISSAGPSRSFLDGVSYDLNVATSGPSSEIRMIFSEIPAEELQANFQGRWTITGDGTRWIGDFDIDRAQYTFFKQFDATGSLRYSGEFQNPELNIVARYQSTRTVVSPTDSTTSVERVVVSLKITGTRNEPKHEMSMTIDDLDYYAYTGPKSSDLESDAIAFILAGNFPLTRSESTTIATDIQTSVGASMMVGASSILTKELSEYLRRETGFITSVELGYEGQGSFSQSADIRLSGTAFKGYWRYRGTILDNPFSNAHVSLLYSFGDIFDNPTLRNFMFELERRAETGTTGAIDDRQEVNSARLFYRFSF